MATILEPAQYLLIYNISYLQLLSLAAALYNGHYVLAMGTCLVFSTSLNYWRYPVATSWRRYIDILAVTCVLAHHHIRAWSAEHAVAYYTVLCMAKTLYPLSYYYYERRDYWKSTYAHVALHVLANTGNLILYSGRM
jgi:hypothetical protein